MSNHQEDGQQLISTYRAMGKPASEAGVSADAEGTFTPHCKVENNKLESASFFYVQDLLCEGPIHGLVDKDGNDLRVRNKFFVKDDWAKGLYLNNVSVKNHITDSYNYNRVDFSLKSGTEMQGSEIEDSDTNSNLTILQTPFKITTANPSISYEINKPLFGIRDFNAGARTSSFIKGDKQSGHSSCVILADDTDGETSVGIDPGLLATNLEARKTSIVKDMRALFSSGNFEQNFGVYHEVINNPVSFLVLTLKISQLFIVGKKGDTGSHVARFGIELGYARKGPVAYVVHSVRGISSGSGYLFDMFFDISKFDFSLVPYIKVFSFNELTPTGDFKTNLSVGVQAVTEIIDAELRYPNSAYSTCRFDARSFSSVPSRTFDVKMLKIKVPENYDAEAKTYSGNWTGQFDPVLRWTDNPAWILYDIITNSKYAGGKFNIPESLVDKWNLYRIAKYCDEMVPTGNVPRSSTAIKSLTSRSVILENPWSQIKVGDEIHITNCSFVDAIDGQVYYRSFKKIVVDSVLHSDNTHEFIVCNDFGILKLLSLFGDDKSSGSVRSLTEGAVDNGQALTSSQIEAKNMKGVKRALIDQLSDKKLRSRLNDYLRASKDQIPFSADEVAEYTTLSGKCAPFSGKKDGELEFVEPRFTGNFYIQNETEIVNLVNNIASVFRGFSFWSNSLIDFNNDQALYPTYFFNNANVKNGIFQYAGSSIDTRFTTVKITFSDKNSNFRDRTIYVEDRINLRKYGYIEKELLGFGITTKSQAKRLGEWFLATNQFETELVSFTTGLEGQLVSPGDIISVSDSLKLTKRLGGRVVSKEGSVITLDSEVDISVNDTISFIIAVGKKDSESLNGLTSVSDRDIDSLKPSFIFTFTVTSVTKVDFRTQIEITHIVNGTEAKMGSITGGTLWIYETNSADTETDYTKEYKIMGIKEASDNEYEITAAEYFKGKYDYVENDANIDIKPLYGLANPTAAPKTKDYSDDLTGKFTDYVRQQDYKPDEGSESYGYSGGSEEILNNYDYIIGSNSYSDEYYNASASTPGAFRIVRVIVLVLKKIYDELITAPNLLERKGIIVQYSLGSQKISVKYDGRGKPAVKIVVPSDGDGLYEFDQKIAVYIFGENNEIL
jgi:hypothetical protein